MTGRLPELAAAAVRWLAGAALAAACWVFAIAAWLLACASVALLTLVAEGIQLSSALTRWGPRDGVAGAIRRSRQTAAADQIPTETCAEQSGTRQ